MRKRVPRKRWLSLLISSIFALLTATSSAFSAEGVVISIQGKSTVRAHGADSPARAGMRLKPGFRIRSLEGTVYLLMDDGRVQSIKEGGSFTVPEERGPRAKDDLASRLMSAIRETTLRGKAPTIEEEARGEREIVLIYPFNSFIASDALRFEWEATEGLANLEVTLKSPSPVYQFAFKPNPGESRAPFPEKAPPLSAGVRYYWKVTGFSEANGETYRSRLRWFAILGPQKSESLQMDVRKIESMADLDERGKAYLLANLFTSYGLYHRAVGVIEETLVRDPGDLGMKEMLQGIYEKMKK